MLGDRSMPGQTLRRDVLEALFFGPVVNLVVADAPFVRTFSPISDSGGAHQRSNDHPGPKTSEQGCDRS